MMVHEVFAVLNDLRDKGITRSLQNLLELERGSHGSGQETRRRSSAARPSCSPAWCWRCGRRCRASKHPIVSRFGENIRLSSYLAHRLSRNEN
jgi:hypothetical protein